jgi:hypothetical protein
MGLKRGRVARAEFDGIGDQPHGGTRRENVLLLRDVLFQDVVLQGAGKLRPIDPLLLGHHQVHGPQDGGRRVDGHGDRHVAQRNAAEENLHVFERRNGRAALAHFAFAEGVVGVVAHQGGQVEGHRKSRLALRQQVVIAAVGFFRSGEAGELAHGPELAAIHVADGCRGCTGTRRAEALRARDRRPRDPAGRTSGSIGTPLIVVNWRSAVFMKYRFYLIPALRGAGAC